MEEHAAFEAEGGAGVADPGPLRADGGHACECGFDARIYTSQGETP
jgi:hypothetical protein